MINNYNQNRLKAVSVVLFYLLMIGCGGGTSNSPPTSVSISNTSVLEGTQGATIGTLTTVDPDGGGFSYTISGYKIALQNIRTTLTETYNFSTELAAVWYRGKQNLESFSVQAG